MGYKDLMWPQQKAMVFGLSSLLLIEKDKIPSNLGQKYLKIIDVTAKCVIFMNWEEYEEDDENNEAALVELLQKEEDAENENKEKEEEEMDSDTDEDEEEDESNDDDSFAGVNLIDVDANADYVDDSDIKYMAQCCGTEANTDWMLLI